MKIFGFINLALFVLGLPALAQPVLVYTGLTDSGWQVYLHNLETGESKQLTQSPGDKRVPRYIASWDAVVYRDSRGRISLVESDGTKGVWSELEGCADFAIRENGEGEPTQAFVTRLVTGNPQRQLIWELTVPDILRPIARAPKGSLRQVTLRVDGGFFATHLWRRGEERLIEFPPLTEEGEQGPPLYWTPENEVAAYPLFVPGQGVVYSQKTSPLNYDLVFKATAESSPQVIVSSSEWSEQASTLSGDQATLFFERSDKSGNWSLASSNFDPAVEQKEVRKIALPHQAKEPRWADIPAQWLEQ